MYLRALYKMAVVMDPDRDWRWIREVASRVRMRAEPVRRKRDRMVSSHELLLLGNGSCLPRQRNPVPACAPECIGTV